MITRLDDSTIDTTALTAEIEALTRAANVHGLTVTILNDAEKVYSRAFGVADLPSGNRCALTPRSTARRSARPCSPYSL